MSIFSNKSNFGT